jgi:hypothetical protein
MPFKPGQSGNPEGRPKGTKNKNTKIVRQAFQQLTEDNLENMTIWLSQVASEDPSKALDIMLRLSEYIIPKLARTEVTGSEGEDLFKNIKFQFGPDINDTVNRVDE